MKDKLGPVIQKVDLLLAELREVAGRGPRFRIVHRLREPGADCLPGEEISFILLIHRGREYLLPLSLALRILFDYLARHRRLPQNAVQIVSGMRVDAFYTRHGANAQAGVRQTRRFGRSAVKEYIARLRRALEVTFREAGARPDPFAVLVSEPTEGNEVRYRLRATVEWVHVD